MFNQEIDYTKLECLIVSVKFPKLVEFLSYLDQLGNKIMKKCACPPSQTLSVLFPTLKAL